MNMLHPARISLILAIPMLSAPAYSAVIQRVQTTAQSFSYQHPTYGSSDTDSGETYSISDASVKYNYLYACGTGADCVANASIESKAYGSLASGKMGVRTIINDPLVATGYTSVDMFDDLYFSLPTGVDRALVTFNYAVDGHVDAMSFLNGTNDGSLYWSISVEGLDAEGTGKTIVQGGGTIVPTGFISSYSTADPTDGLISTFSQDGLSGGFWVDRALSYYTVRLQMVGQGPNDFYHTGTFSFPELPGGVSFASASGVFLTEQVASVPEPAVGGMMITGLAIFGAALRRRPGNRSRSLTA